MVLSQISLTGNPDLKRLYYPALLSKYNNSDSLLKPSYGKTISWDKKANEKRMATEHHQHIVIW